MKVKECKPCIYPNFVSKPTLELLPQNSSSNPPRLGHIVFKSMSLLHPPLLGKTISLFFFTLPKTLVFKIWHWCREAELLAWSVASVFDVFTNHFHPIPACHQVLLLLPPEHFLNPSTSLSTANILVLATRLSSLDHSNNLSSAFPSTTLATFAL